jgi:hypothetical protein
MARKMDGVWVKVKVGSKQFDDILNAEFVDLKIECEDCADTIRLYPMKSIRRYDL